MARPRKVVDGFCSGMIVRKFHKWGNNEGTVDLNSIYLIRKIGPSMAMIDRLNSETLEKVPYRRGRNERINTKEEYDQYASRNAGPVPVWDYPYNWAHVFVQVGQEGWDPDF